MNLKIFSVFTIPEYKSFLWPLVLYIVFLIVTSLFNYRDDVISASSELRMQTLFILSFISLLAYFNDYSKNLNLISEYLNFGLGILIILSLLGLGVEEKGAFRRIVIFGMNPNRVSFFLLYFIFINLHLTFTNKNKLMKWLRLALIMLSLIVFVKLGSMSSLVLLFAGLIVYFILKERDFFKKLKFIVLGLFLIVPVTVYISNTETFSKRLNDKENIENLSGRKKFWELGYSLFKENPVTGIGLYESAYLKDDNLGFEASFHNIYLEILVATGLIGLLFFLVFLITLFFNFWKLYHYYQNPLFVIFWIFPVIILFSSQFSFLFFTFLLNVGWIKRIKTF